MSIEAGIPEDVWQVVHGADLKKVAETAIGGAFGNSGQLYVAIERLYVHNHDLEKFEQILKRGVEPLKLGSANKFDFDLGTSTSSGQLERVSDFVDRAKQEGAAVPTGSQAHGVASKLMTGSVNINQWPPW